MYCSLSVRYFDPADSRLIDRVPCGSRPGPVEATAVPETAVRFPEICTAIPGTSYEPINENMFGRSRDPRPPFALIRSFGSCPALPELKSRPVARCRV